MGCSVSKLKTDPTGASHPPPADAFLRRRLSIGMMDVHEDAAAKVSEAADGRPGPSELKQRRSSQGNNDIEMAARARHGLGKRRMSFQSPEIEDQLNGFGIRALGNPFPETRVSTFTNHGVKPNMAGGGSQVKTNQDRGLLTYPVGENVHQALLCVFDGHGKAGEEVSEFMMLRLPDLLEQDKKRLADEATTQKSLVENLLLADRLLKEDQTPSASNGCTALVCFVRGQDMWVANVGDSRAVKGTLVKDSRRDEPTGGSGGGSSGGGGGAGGDEEGAPQDASREQWVVEELNDEHKPDEPGEKKRIEQYGGKVSKASKKLGPARIWFGSDGPGLAMSRAIGDHACRRFGVVATPEVRQIRIEANDRVLILATDGVWEFITSAEAVAIVARHLGDANGAARALINGALRAPPYRRVCVCERETASRPARPPARTRLPEVPRACRVPLTAARSRATCSGRRCAEATARWTAQEGEYRDDITCIVAFFPFFPGAQDHKKLPKLSRGASKSALKKVLSFHSGHNIMDGFSAKDGGGGSGSGSGGGGGGGGGGDSDREKDKDGRKGSDSSALKKRTSFVDVLQPVADSDGDGADGGGGGDGAPAPAGGGGTQPGRDSFGKKKSASFRKNVAEVAADGSDGMAIAVAEALEKEKAQARIIAAQGGRYSDLEDDKDVDEVDSIDNLDLVRRAEKYDKAMADARKITSGAPPPPPSGPHTSLSPSLPSFPSCHPQRKGAFSAALCARRPPLPLPPPTLPPFSPRAGRVSAPPYRPHAPRPVRGAAHRRSPPAAHRPPPPPTRHRRRGEQEVALALGARPLQARQLEPAALLKGDRRARRGEDGRGRYARRRGGRPRRVPLPPLVEQGRRQGGGHVDDHGREADRGAAEGQGPVRCAARSRAMNRPLMRRPRATHAPRLHPPLTPLVRARCAAAQSTRSSPRDPHESTPRTRRARASRRAASARPSTTPSIR